MFDIFSVQTDLLQEKRFRRIHVDLISLAPVSELPHHLQHVKRSNLFSLCSLITRVLTTTAASCSASERRPLTCLTPLTFCPFSTPESKGSSQGSTYSLQQTEWRLLITALMEELPGSHQIRNQEVKVDALVPVSELPEVRRKWENLEEALQLCDEGGGKVSID